MDYSKYRFESVADWIEVEIQTAERVKFWTLRNAIRSALNLPEKDTPVVTPIDGENHASDRFIVRIQDPERAGKVERVLNAINDAHPLVQGLQGVSVVAIEISLDVYNAPSEFVGHMLKYITNRVSDNQRIYRDFKGSPQALPVHQDSLNRFIADGYQVGIGNEDDEQYQHAYYKQTDGKDENGNAVELALDDHRPRYEIRLRGAGLPCTEWNDWRSFKFESLRKDCFNFRKLKDNLTAEERTQWESRTFQVGRKKTHQRRGGHTREFNRATEADKALNDRVRDSLRNLSKRWMASDCKKVGSPTLKNPCSRLESDKSSYNYLSEDILLSIIREIEQEELEAGMPKTSQVGAGSEKSANTTNTPPPCNSND